MNKNIVALLVASPLAFSACHRAPPPPPPPAAPEVAPSRLSLGERLQQERTTRPAAHPTPEELAAALTQQGVSLERWQQVLASPIGARFCMAGQTALGNVVAVCEFGDGQQAERGVAYSKATFDRLIPNRTLLRRGSTVLTLTRGDASSKGADEARAISGVFSAILASL
jgi:hypothetical protein